MKGLFLAQCGGYMPGSCVHYIYRKKDVARLKMSGVI